MSLFRAIFALLGAVLLGLLVATPASAATNPPPPENPLANSGVNAFSPKPAMMPDASLPFDPNDLLTHYGTAGPHWHTYDLNPFEEVGASTWVQLANGGMDNSVMILSGTATFAGWVFNPTSLLDELAKPADDTAQSLLNSVGVRWLPLALLIVTAIALWAARKGHLSLVLTRVLFVVVGLGLVGLASAQPSSYARVVSDTVADTVASVLVPQTDGDVESDADAIAYAQAKTRARAEVGTRLVGPLYRAAVYDPWVMGALGSSTSNTAHTYAAQLWQAQALTWNEAVAADSNRDVERRLTDEHKKRWADIAAQVDGSDPEAYANLQGARMTPAPVVVSYAVIATSLPFLLVAMLMVLACYVGMFLLAALCPLIGLFVILWPQALEKVGKFAMALIVNGIVYAVAAVAVLKLSSGLLASAHVLLAIIFIGLASWLCWKLLRPFRQFGEGAPAMRMNAHLSRKYRKMERLYYRGGRYSHSARFPHSEAPRAPRAETPEAPPPVAPLAPEAAPPTTVTVDININGEHHSASGEHVTVELPARPQDDDDDLADHHQRALPRVVVYDPEIDEVVEVPARQEGVA